MSGNKACSGEGFEPRVSVGAPLCVRWAATPSNAFRLTRSTRKHAVCRGFFDAYQRDIAPLRLAVAMGKIKEQS